MSPVAEPLVQIRGQITAWSFSRWQDYEKCPYAAGLKHVNKQKEPANKAMDRGSAIHTLAEKFADNKLHKLPPELVKFKAQFLAMRKLQPSVEQNWAFTDEWTRTGWFDNNAWLRIKVDAHYLEHNKPMNKNTLVIIDHKTGKRDDEKHKMQLELYNLGGLLMYPDVASIRSELWYLDIGDIVPMEVLNGSRVLATSQKLWLKRTRAMLNDKMFAPRPGPYCRYCHFRKENGGPCPH